MTREQRNIVNYVVLGLVAFMLGCIAALIPELNGPPEAEINWRMILSAGLSAFMATAGAMLLPRVGSSHLAADVDKLKKRGVKKSDMKVVQKVGTGAVRPTSGEHAP